jgi:glycosyltransferase involved in cell wall biosynthesis
MTQNPVISVLMPVYNGERFLKEAIESILKQSYTNFEFIIINDGSTDLTEKIILEFSDKRIVYIKNEANLKLIKTLNKGIDLANGKYIARMDADDISHPDRFRIQLEQILKNDCKIVSSSYSAIDEQSRRIGFHLGLIADEVDLKFVSLFFCPIAHPTVLIETSLMKDYYYKDDKTCMHIEDYDLWSRILKDDVKFFVSNESLLLYRRTNLNITEIHKEELVSRHINIAKQNQNKFIDEFLSDDVNVFFIAPYLIRLSNLNKIYKEISDAKRKFNDVFYVKFSIETWLDYRFLISLTKCKISFVKKAAFIIFHPIILFRSTIYIVKNSILIR